MPTTYLSAADAFGHVPLGRACRFSALLRELRVSSAPAGPVAGDDADDVLVPVTAADVPETPDGGPDGLDVARAFELTVRPIYEAVVGQGRYGEFAAVVCVARDGDGDVRPLRDGEADGDGFPAAVFASGFASFIAASSTITMSLVGTPPGTA